MHIARTIYLCDGSLRERASRSPTTAPRTCSLTLSLAFASDFADIFEVRGIRRRAPRQELERRSQGPAAWCCRIAVSTVATRETAMSFEPAPTQLDEQCRRPTPSQLAPGAKAHDLRHRLQPRTVAEIDALVLQGARPAPSRAARRHPIGGQRRDLQRGAERDPVPLDGRPLHADDGDAARDPIPTPASPGTRRRSGATG